MNMSILRKPIVAITCLAAAASANAATITPKYDAAVDQKYWSADFKKKIEVACKTMGDFIADDITVEITMTVGETGGAAATGGPTSSSVKTQAKFISSSGKITFNIHDFDETSKSWPGAGIELVVHEIIHCLGFSSGVDAFKNKINANNEFSGNKVIERNGKAFPLASLTDVGHFKNEADARGDFPRMSAGGGGTLSWVDLAALEDLGYSIRYRNRENFTVPPIMTNGLFASSYLGSFTMYGAKNFVGGSMVNDRITNRFSPSSRIILQGSGGSDILIAADAATETVMIGDKPEELEKGNDNPDSYVMPNTSGVVILVGVGNNDTIVLPANIGPIANGTAANPAENGSAATLVTVERMPRGTEAEIKLASSLGGYDFGTKTQPVYYNARKVTLTRVEYNGTYEIVNSKRVFTRATVGAEKSRSVVFTFYCYVKNKTTSEDFQSHLQSRIRYVADMNYRGVYEPQ